MIRMGRIGIFRSVPGFLAPRDWFSSDAGCIRSHAGRISSDAGCSRSAERSDRTRRSGNVRRERRFRSRSFVFCLYVQRVDANCFGIILCIRRVAPGDRRNSCRVSAESPGRFGVFLCIARSGWVGRFTSSGKNGSDSPRFGIFLYERVSLPARRAARCVGRAERAHRFGVSQSVRAPRSSRRFAMIPLNAY